MQKLQYDRQRFKGIRVIPDVHGVYESFKALTDEAQNEDLFVLQLGDLLDRGPENGLTLQHMLDLEDEGRGTWVMGNHDWKHLRYFRGAKVEIKPYQTATIDQIVAIDGLVERFVQSGETTSFWLQLENFWFAHAAVHYRMKDFTDFDDKNEVKYLRERAMYGQTHPELKNENGFPVPLFTWMSRLSGDNTVFLGHHALDGDRIPICTQGKTETIFLDGGCGKDKHSLRYVDLIRAGNVHVMKHSFETNVVDFDGFMKEYVSVETV